MDHEGLRHATEDQVRSVHSAAEAQHLDAERLRRVEAMMHSLRRYIEIGAHEALNLRNYQRTGVRNVSDFFEEKYDKENSNPLAELSGYYLSPPAGGKTRVITALIQGMNPQKALVLTGTTTALKQLAGERYNDGELSSFLPHMPMSIVAHKHKDTSGRIVGMTYEAFRSFAKKNALSDYDLVVADEGHNVGEVTGRYLRGVYPLIGFSASPRGVGAVHMNRFFKHKIHEEEPVPLIEVGYLGAMQLYGLATNRQLKVKSKSNAEDFSERELAPLINDEARNNSIVDVIEHFIAEGRKIVVNCVPGGEAAHARLLASMTRQRCGVFAEAVHGFPKDKTNQQILEEFRRQQVGVIFQVKLLNESWDEPSLSCLINAVPTRSLRIAIQRLGRLYRLNEEWPVAVAIDIIDDVLGARVQTVFDALGLGIEQARVVRPNRERILGSQSVAKRVSLSPPPSQEQQPTRAVGVDNAIVADLTRPPDKGGALILSDTAYEASTVTPQSLPSNLLRMSDDFSLYIDRREEVTKKTRVYEGVPTGWLALRDIVADYPNLGLTGNNITTRLATILRTNGVEVNVFDTNEGALFFGAPGTLEVVEGYKPPETASATQKTQTQICTELGITMTWFDAIVEREQIQGTELLSPTVNRLVVYYDASQQEIIAERVKERKQELESLEQSGYISLSELAEEVGEVRGSVSFFLKARHGIEGLPGASKLHAGHRTSYYTQEEAQWARFHFKHRKFTKGDVPIERIEEQVPQTRNEIIAFIEQANINSLGATRYVDGYGDYHYTEYCFKNSDAENIINNLRSIKTSHVASIATDIVVDRSIKEQSFVDQMIDLQTLSVKYNIDPQAFPLILARLPAREAVVRDESGSVIGMKRGMDSVLEAFCTRYELAPEGRKNAYQIGRAHNINPEDVKVFVRSLPLVPTSLWLHWTRTDKPYLTVHFSTALTKKVEQWARKQQRIQQNKLKSR